MAEANLEQPTKLKLPALIWARPEHVMLMMEVINDFPLIKAQQSWLAYRQEKHCSFQSITSGEMANYSQQSWGV